MWLETESLDCVQPAAAFPNAACLSAIALATEGCEPGGIGSKEPAKTLGCPPRSRLHWGKRQQAARSPGTPSDVVDVDAILARLHWN